MDYASIPGERIGIEVGDLGECGSYTPFFVAHAI